MQEVHHQATFLGGILKPAGWVGCTQIHMYSVSPARRIKSAEKTIFPILLEMIFMLANQNSRRYIAWGANTEYSYPLPKGECYPYFRPLLLLHFATLIKYVNNNAHKILNVSISVNILRRKDDCINSLLNRSKLTIFTDIRILLNWTCAHKQRAHVLQSTWSAQTW